MPAIELQGVTKRFASSGLLTQETVTALEAVDLTVADGEIFGFLGPNGAGKSTTIDLLLGYTRPTAGTVRILGHEVAADTVDLRQRIGVLPDGYGAIGERTGRQHLEFTIETKDVDDDPDDLLERVEMLDPADYPVVDYSKGMVQRIMLAMALVGEPDLLILDEPSTGLDPNGARLMREIVREENSRGATIFFSSHILEQVEAVCDRVGILDRGRLVAVDTIDALRSEMAQTAEVTATLSAIPSALGDRIRAISGVESVDITGQSIRIRCENEAKATVISKLYDCGEIVETIATDEGSLDDLFGAYTRGIA